MSHIVSIQTEIRDPVALAAACERLRLPAPVQGTAKLFTTTAAGHCVQLPDWQYPIVCDTQSGQLQYDNFEGRWGDPKGLGLLLQAYAVEKARIEARRLGHTAIEQVLADGSIKLTIQLGEST
jgi:hypothetical protein